MTNSLSSITVQLAFVDANPARPDPAHVSAEARSVTEALRGQGYTVTPTSTSERGGALYDVVMQLAQNLHENKELLIALLTTATPIITYLLEQRKKNKEKKPAAPSSQPTEIVIKLGQAQVSVEAEKPLAPDALLEQLLRDDPELLTMPLTGLTVQVQVPSRVPRSI